LFKKYDLDGNNHLEFEVWYRVFFFLIGLEVIFSHTSLLLSSLIVNLVPLCVCVCVCVGICGYGDFSQIPWVSQVTPLLSGKRSLDTLVSSENNLSFHRLTQ
jgi:hypothetical protein